MVVQGGDRRRPPDQAEGGEEQEQRRDQHRDTHVAGGGAGEQDHRVHRLQDAAGEDQALGLEAFHQVRRELGQGDEADRVGRVDGAVEPGRGVVDLDEDEGGVGDVGREGQLHEGDHGYGADVGAVPDQATPDPQHLGDVGGGAVGGLAGLGDQQERGACQEAVGGGEPEDEAPGHHADEASAQHRRQDRAEAQDHDAHGQQTRGLVAGVAVANGGGADGDGRSGPQALQEAAGNQHRRRGRQGARDGREDEQHHAAGQRRLAAEAVR